MTAVLQAPAPIVERPAGIGDRVHVKPSTGWPMPRTGRVFGFDPLTGQVRVQVDMSQGGHRIYCQPSSLTVLERAS